MTGAVFPRELANWTRDGAITAIELAAGPLPTTQPLIDYVQFAQTCQNSASSISHFDRASFLINGTPRNWTDQTDGPALQTLAALRLYAQLDAPTQATANAVIAANLNFLQNAYQGQTYNLWEEEHGASFFARSVQLQCFQAITPNTVGIGVPAWLPAAIPWLQNALASHWNGQYYQSMLPVPTDYRAPYDPNIDIVMAAIYGAIPVTDTKLLTTAAQLRSQWADPDSAYFYPINGTDQQRGIGPLLGRYPGDVYDGDTDAGRRSSLGGVHGQLRRAVLPAGRAGHHRRNGSARQSLSRLLQPDRGGRVDHASCGRGGAASRRRPDAAGGHLPQRQPRAQRAVRRHHRIREERQQPVLELRLIPVRDPRQDRQLR